MTETPKDSRGHTPRPRKPRCRTCHYPVSKYRELKRCPKCELVKPLHEFGHNRGRPDHAESQCRSCKQARQKREYRAAHLGSLATTGDLGSFASIQDGFVVGKFRQRRPFAGGRTGGYWVSTETGRSVRQLTLGDTVTDSGERLGVAPVSYTHPAIADAALRRGEWVGVVYEAGLIVKFVRLDHPELEPVIDEALETYEVPRGSEFEGETVPVTAVPGSWSPARPWLEPFVSGAEEYLERRENLPEYVNLLTVLSEVENDLMRAVIARVEEEEEEVAVV